VVQPSVRRPSRRPGRWQTVLGLLLILAVIAVVADRAAAALATDELRSRLAGELSARDVSYNSLDVAIAGTPFLTQVAQGQYKSITINLADVRLRGDGAEATLPALDVVATGVSADAVSLARGDEGASVTADQVVGTAVISYAGLSSLIDLSDYFITDVAFSERDGALYATGIVGALGLEAPIEAGAEITLQDGQIQLRFRDAVASGQALPDAGLPVLDALANAVIVATMPPLPFGITLDALQVTPNGVAITATGQAVTLVTG
jgi:LmeA-like phospholipid-binding